MGQPRCRRCAYFCPGVGYIVNSSMIPVMVVMPAYNECTVIAAVVAQVLQVCPNLLVVDDGSSDGTAEVARGAGAIVVRHAINLGQGAALQTGILHALDKGAQTIVTFDADGQHDPSDIKALVTALDSGFGAALGSRFAGKTLGMPAQRRLVLQAARWVNYAITGVKLSDAHNGIRALSRSAALNLHLREAGMAHATEIIGQLARAKVKIVEVPVTIHYSAYSLAKGQKLTNALRILLDLMMRGLQK